MFWMCTYFKPAPKMYWKIIGGAGNELTREQLCKYYSFEMPLRSTNQVAIQWNRCFSSTAVLRFTANHSHRMHPTKYYSLYGMYYPYMEFTVFAQGHSVSFLFFLMWEENTTRNMSIFRFRQTKVLWICFTRPFYSSTYDLIVQASVSFKYACIFTISTHAEVENFFKLFDLIVHT